MKSIIKWIAFLIFINVFCSDSFASNSFVPIKEPQNIYSPLKKLGIYLGYQEFGMPPFYIRQSIPQAPGDYYRFPLGATPKTKTPEMQNEIEITLQATVGDSYHSNSIIDSIKIYRYRPTGDSLYRDDFFIRYSLGDTIFVISGWLGKFLSFYRAVPGVIKYDYNSLQNEISKLAVIDIKIPEEIFSNQAKENPYFIEYINKKRAIRVRCYQISEQIGEFGDKTAPRTLIEITKFYDKGVIP